MSWKQLLSLVGITPKRDVTDGLTDQSAPEAILDAIRRGARPDAAIPAIDFAGRPRMESAVPLAMVAMKHVHDVETLDMLVDAMRAKGVSLALCDQFGGGLLHAAAKYSGSIPVLDRLLALGIDVNAKHQCTYSALSDGSVPPPWMTPLHYAMQQDDPQILRHLLGRGADPNAANPHGYTALRETNEDPARRMHRQALLDHGAKPKRSRKS